MSWKNIKTFLIILFILINVYLIFSTNGFVFKSPHATYVDKKNMENTINIIEKNFNVIIDKKTIPKSVDNLINIDVTNIIYTDNFINSGYSFETKGTQFEAKIKTDTFSYNETNAKEEFIKILGKIGISEDRFAFTTYKSDSGLHCEAREIFSPYPIFNGKINAVFKPTEIILKGSWYIPQVENTKDLTSTSNMTDVTGIIIDMASKCAAPDGSPVTIIKIDFGYYVSSYDENVVSKSSSAIPCYMLKTDEGIKYYYDASNGKPIKQEG